MLRDSLVFKGLQAGEEAAGRLILISGILEARLGGGVP